MVCGFARIDGRSVGVVANQPKVPRRRARRGVGLQRRPASCAPATPSACRWWCSWTRPGSCPAPSRSRAARSVTAPSSCTRSPRPSVPKITVVLRKAFGGAFIAMNSRDLGADFAFAWPRAMLGVMGAKQAVGNRQPPRHRGRRGPRGGAQRVRRALHDRHLTSGVAAAEGYVDEVIPRRTPAAGSARPFPPSMPSRPRRVE